MSFFEIVVVALPQIVTDQAQGQVPDKVEGINEVEKCEHREIAESTRSNVRTGEN